MITVTFDGRQMIASETGIGNENDNRIVQIQFDVPTIFESGQGAYVCYRQNDGETGVVMLGGDGVWTIGRGITSVAGPLTVFVRVVSPNDEVWNSNEIKLKIKNLIDIDSDAPPADDPDALEAALALMSGYAARAEAGETGAENAQAGAETARDQVLGAVDAAVLSATEAWAAKMGAEMAESGAVAARDTAVSAREAAVEAKDAAQGVQGEVAANAAITTEKAAQADVSAQTASSKAGEAAMSAEQAEVAKYIAQELVSGLEGVRALVTTLPEGASATANAEMIDGNVVISLGIPKGATGNGVKSFVRTSGTGAPGTTDVYTLTMTDGSTFPLSVYNGKDGTGTGDMHTSTYDTNNDGIVDRASVADELSEDSGLSKAVLTQTATGNPVTITPAQNRALEVTMECVSKQTVTVQGKNLLNQAALTTITKNGVTLSYDSSDDTLVLNGACTQGNTTISLLTKSEVFPAGAYAARVDYVSGTGTMCNAADGAVSQRYYALQISKNPPWQDQLSLYVTSHTSFAKTYLTTDYSNVVQMRFDPGASFANLKFRVQLEKGSAATPYERFTPDSPSPMYPTPITGRESVRMDVCGVNLFNHADLAKPLQPHVTADDDGWITATVNNTTGTEMYADYYTNPSTRLKPSTQYAMICEIAEASCTGEVNFRVFGDYSTYPAQFAGLWDLKNAAVAVGCQVKIASTKASFSGSRSMLRTFISIKPGGSVHVKYRLSVMEDILVTPAAFTYRHFVSATRTITPATPLWGLPGARDSVQIGRDGAGMAVRRTKRVVLNGTEGWYTSPCNDGTTYKHHLGGLFAGAVQLYDASVIHAVCTHYPPKSASWLYLMHTSAGFGFTTFNTMNAAFYDPAYKSNDSTAWKAYLAAQYAAGTPVTLVYELAEPVTEALAPGSPPLTSPVDPAVEPTTITTDADGLTVQYAAHAPDNEISALRDEVQAHIGDVDNPHRVTAEQVGARPDTWMPSAADVGAEPAGAVAAHDEAQDAHAELFAGKADKSEIVPLSPKANANGFFDRSSVTPTGTTKLNYSGYFEATRVLGSYFSDYAECFDVRGEVETEPGDVVGLDLVTGDIRRCDTDASPYVVGVVSNAYFSCIGRKDGETNVPVGLAGKLPVKVKGVCRAGDNLVSAGDGYARALRNGETPPIGAVMGMALENRAEAGVAPVLMLIRRR